MYTLIPCRIIPVILALYPAVVKAQFPVDPYRAANGNCVVFSASSWSGGFGNIAATDSLYRFSLAGYGSRPFMLEELSEGGAVVSCNWTFRTSLSFAYASKGNSLFRRSFLSAGLAQRFGKSFSAGLRLERTGTLQGENYGRSRSLFCSSGIMVRLSHLLDAGTVFSIPIRKITETQALLFSTGLRFRFSEIFRVSAELSLQEKILVMRAAFSYRPHPRLELNGGLGGKPLSLSFGFNLLFKDFSVFISAVHRPVLGFSPVAGISGGWK